MNNLPTAGSLPRHHHCLLLQLASWISIKITAVNFCHIFDIIYSLIALLFTFALLFYKTFNRYSLINPETSRVSGSESRKPEWETEFRLLRRARDGRGDHFDNVRPWEKCKISSNCFVMDSSDFSSSLIIWSMIIDSACIDTFDFNYCHHECTCTLAATDIQKVV